MEKHELRVTGGDADEQSQQKKVSTKSRQFIVMIFLVYAFWILWPTQGTWFPLGIDPPTSSEETTCKPFSWNDIPTKPYLDYVPCYGEFQCARLELPMDYWNETTNATVSIAVVKLPAVVPVTHPQYGGVTLHNPGGPGGSGVVFLLGLAPFLRQIIDSDDGHGKYFDHLSFDPRGIGYTTPRVNCFHDYWADYVWAVKLGEQGLFSASDAALGRLWSMENARGQSCSIPPGDGKLDVKKYVSTASVARDMLEIVERHGEWREKEARRLLQSRGDCDKSLSEEARTSDIIESLKYKPGEEKINYWGFSYGSYLGNTFAAMFPSRINRLIVDGVVDAYDYKKALWLDNVVDVEDALGLFYFHCARVGFPTCALANENGETTEDGVKQRLNNITNSLYHNPLPVISPSGPGVITYSVVKYITFGILYSPIGGFEALANILYGIERGDVSRVGQLLQDVRTLRSSDDDKVEEDIDIMGDAQMAIACGDGDAQGWMTKADFADHVSNITKISPIAELWSTLRLRCIHYSVRPYARFEGPWFGNTSHPILEIGNTADPVTPGRYAIKMAKGFKDAVALIQDSGGHCSLSAPSNCTEGYIRKYFQTGELPPKDTICKVDALPFGPGPDDSTVLDEETQRVVDRQRAIAKALYGSGGGFLNGGLRAGLVASPFLG